MQSLPRSRGNVQDHIDRLRLLARVREWLADPKTDPTIKAAFWVGGGTPLCRCANCIGVGEPGGLSAFIPTRLVLPPGMRLVWWAVCTRCARRLTPKGFERLAVKVDSRLVGLAGRN